MAGKSSRGRNKKASQNSANAAAAASAAPVVASAAPVVASAAPVVSANGHPEDNLNVVGEQKVDANGVLPLADVQAATPEVKEPENAGSEGQVKQGDIHLFPVPVKTQFGEKLELQLSPNDSVMDVRQFLLDAPETCFFTCYDLLLHTKDGSAHHLEDYHEISEVADITSGGCSLEMIAALYDDRSIRAHVHRTRELLSLSTLHSSLSTSLALQHEMAQNATANSGDQSNKPEVLELENLGFMEDVSGSLSNLLSSPSKEIKCVESIVFSSFNPPPSYRRLVGDLLYLDVVTLEGSKYCITGTTTTFYVNSSSGNILDPKPTKAASEATTLIGLLQKISSKFKKAFREMLERKASAHPFENIQSLLPPNSWLELHPVPVLDHRRDAARAENSLTLSFGSELIGMQRDWNEELQSCREFPHASPQERILRDRALYKVSSDFVDAAISGAIGVISRCIPPINPTDPECFHMYVHNNIFFSFAVDADLEQLSRKQSSESSEKTSTKSSKVNGEKSNAATSENNAIGVVESVSDAPSEVQLAESEQATYASSNNDLKGTKAYQEADVPGLYNLAMAIVDYRGHRVVAQSVLPGILQGDKSDSLLYGSVDNGKKISWNQDFHSKVLEASKRLRVKEHTVLDGSGNVFQIAAPVECKGIVGSDDRHYLLDLMRVTPRDANYTGPNSKFCILRPELITAFCQAEAAKNLKSKREPEDASKSVDSLKDDTAEQVDQAEPAKIPETSDTKSIESEDKAVIEESGSKPADVADKSEDIRFNPNVFTEFKLAGSPEEIAADEESVRKVSSYLKDTVLPKFIQDLCTLEVSPMDGQTLTEALHAHGINVRYIGKVADGTKHLPHLWDLCSNEIIVRCAKHILKDVLRDTADHDIGQAIAHFFNCLFGDCQTVSGKGGNNNTQSKNQKKDLVAGKSTKGHSRSKVGGVATKRQASCMNLSSENLWSNILEFAKVKYQFELPEDVSSRVKKISVIRNLCLKVGVAIAAKKYDLSAATPFQTSDILNLQPVVKHSIPVCQEAKELVETGKVQLAEGMLNEAYTLFTEAFTILQQVTGPMHREVANCCRYLAMVLYHAGDMAAAIMQQHKELIINERCLGLDHPDTAHSYGNMALFYHGLNQSELALRHMSRALLLLSLSSGPDHPDVAATYINVAMMYQDIGKMNTALRYLQEALKKNERLLGEEHIQTAVCYHALAIAFNCVGAYKLSHQHEKKTYDILVKQLGEDDSRTRDSENWMKTFKARETQMAAQKQKGQAVNAVSTQAAIDLLKAHPDLIQAFQAASGGGASGSGGNSSVGGENFARSGRGVDERSARAVAEARKKAAARGLLIRPHGVPVQALPPLTQLLNIINSGMTPENANAASEDTSGAQNPGEAAKAEQGQAPVGLGTGLAALDSKKQNQK